MRQAFLPAMLVLLLCAAARAEEGWQRVAAVRSDTLDVTLLLRESATPADPLFVGWELHNKTDAPLLVDNASYRLDDVRATPLDGGGASIWSGFIRGNDYDLMRREGPPPPKVGYEPPALPPGVTRRLAYASGYGHYRLLDATPGGVKIEGKAFFNLTTQDADNAVTGRYATPQEGVAFTFEYRPPDAAGIASMRRELTAMLDQPPEGVDDVVYAHHLGRLLARPEVAQSATVDTLLAALDPERIDNSARSVIVGYLNDHHASDPAVIDRYVRGLAGRATSEWLRDLSGEARDVTDARLIEPLAERSENPRYWSDVGLALGVLVRHRPLADDPAALSRRLGRVAAGEVPASFRDGTKWTKTIADLLVDAGDAANAALLAPFLDDERTLYSRRDISLVLGPANGLPIRVKDEAANAALELLGDTATPRASIYGAVTDEGAELARRDAVAARLRARLTGK